MKEPTRVVLAEDHELVRAGFRRLLEDMQDVTVIAEASNGREALRVVEKHEPDLLLLDVSMPEMNGFEVLRRVKRSWEAMRVLVVSVHRDRQYVMTAFSEGADGYLVKAAGEVELRTAVASVLRGRRYVSPEVAEHVAGMELGGDSESEMSDMLTPRQREVLQLIVEGNSTSDVAEKLFISVKTVETHRADIQRRLGIFDVAGLVRYAIRTRMISPEE